MRLGKQVFKESNIIQVSGKVCLTLSVMYTENAFIRLVKSVQREFLLFLCHKTETEKSELISLAEYELSNSLQ